MQKKKMPCERPHFPSQQGRQKFALCTVLFFVLSTIRSRLDPTQRTIEEESPNVAPKLSRSDPCPARRAHAPHETSRATRNAQRQVMEIMAFWARNADGSVGDAGEQVETRARHRQVRITLRGAAMREGFISPPLSTTTTKRTTAALHRAR